MSRRIAQLSSSSLFFLTRRLPLPPSLPLPHPIRHPHPFHSLSLSLSLSTSSPRPMTTTTTTDNHTTQADDDKAAFIALFDDVVDVLLRDLRSSFDLSDANVAYVRRVLTYNTPHGKLNRGLAVYQCFKAFHPSSPSPSPSPEDKRAANMLGWCVELLQAFFLVADDIMDGSVTRRGQPCFYRLADIGLNAVNDSIILEALIYRLLRLELANHKRYSSFVTLFQDIAYTTEIGQMLDLTNQGRKEKVNLNAFTQHALDRIYKYKTSHYTFYLPVALGMILGGETDEKKLKKARDICMKMGNYFQAQDDFLDAFGDPKVTGKVGTDIEDNTCTWLVVQAVQMCSTEQKQVLQDNYGRNDEQAVGKVKALYKQLQLPERFAKFEHDSYHALRQVIDEVDDMPTGAFEFLLAKIYKRDK